MVITSQTMKLDKLPRRWTTTEMVLSHKMNSLNQLGLRALLAECDILQMNECINKEGHGGAVVEIMKLFL